MDVHSESVRSYNMSRIKGKNTKPEIKVRKFLFSKGYRYRINVKSLPGSPDIVLTKYKIAIFVNGCFWHGHTSCKKYVIPKTNTEWWLNKIMSNKERDLQKETALKELGWNVFVIWECGLLNKVFLGTMEALILKIEKVNQKN